MTETFALPSGIEVEIKELSGKSEQILADKRELRDGKWLNKFLASALVSVDGKPVPSNHGELVNLLLDMKTGDRNYLMLRVRMASYGEEMQFNWECPKCHATAGYELNLQHLLDDGTLKVYPFRNDMPLIVETRAGIAEVDYMTGRTEQWIAQLKNFDTIYLAMAACSSFNGKPPEYKEFLNMYVKDLTKIRLAFMSLKGGLDPQIELDCPECGSHNKVMLHQIPDFFTPLTMTGSFGL